MKKLKKLTLILRGIFEANNIKEKILFFEKNSLEENFWKDKNSAQKNIKEKNFFEDILNNYLKSQKEVENLLELYQLASTENNKDVID